jgi:hypothetical protein
MYYGSALAARRAAARALRSSIPGWGGADVGFLPFPADRVIRAFATDHGGGKRRGVTLAMPTLSWDAS